MATLVTNELEQEVMHLKLKMKEHDRLFAVLNRELGEIQQTLVKLRKEKR